MSSVVMGYDLNKKAPIFAIKNPVESESMNTINALKFQSEQNNFVVGTRDGMIRLFDFRDTRHPVLQVLLRYFEA